MRGQPGFWEIDERHVRLSEAGDPLEKPNAVIGWEVFRKPLGKALRARCAGRRRGVPQGRGAGPGRRLVGRGLPAPGGGAYRRETVALMLPDSLNPRYSYGGSKIVSELIAFNYGQDHFRKVQVFRPHNVYGPDMGWKHVIPQFVLRALEARDRGDRRFPIQSDGHETRAFAYVDDVVDGIVRMYCQGSHREIYHIGNDHEVSVRDLALLTGRAVGGGRVGNRAGAGRRRGHRPALPSRGCGRWATPPSSGWRTASCGARQTGMSGTATARPRTR